MCDDKKKNFVPYTGMTRRRFTGLAAATSLAGLTGRAQAQTAPAEREVQVRTADGTADAALFHPPGDGRWPGVLWWPDAGGLRTAHRDMGRRLAAQGYLVLVVNPYYRTGNAAAVAPSATGNGQDPAVRERRAVMRAAMTDDAIHRDAQAFVDYLDAQPQASAARIGVHGYCMGGPLSFRTAAARPGRIGAVGSFHGGGLATANPNSPHLLIEKTSARYYIAVAKNDDANEPAVKTTLRETFSKTGKPAMVDVYQGNHGWCVPDSAQYHVSEAERAWAALTGLYKQALV